MRDPVLELTREQLEIIAAAANGLPPAWHERFKASVADSLMHHDRRVCDDEVMQAVASVRDAFVASFDEFDDLY